MTRTTTRNDLSYDAVVVGARCAGAATAMLLAQQGLRVLAIDRGAYGSDTLSTHALMRGGVLQLARWGLLDALKAAGTPTIRTTSFHYGDEVIEIPIKDRDGVDGLYAPRRTVLDALLVDSAREAGVDVMHRTRLTDLIRSDDGRVRGVVIQTSSGEVLRVGADIVIGADGRNSAVARMVGAKTYRKGKHSSATIYGYWDGLDYDGNHWHFNPGVGSGAIPTNDGHTCVFVAMPTERFREELRFDIEGSYHRVLEEASPELAEAVMDARMAGPFRGLAGEVGYLRECQGPGWALVGDSAYFKDPITAHGMTDALRDAELLARAIAKGGRRALVDYQSTRDYLSLGFFDATDEVASYQWDLARVKQVHLQMSDEMRRECEALKALDEVPYRRTA
jgi:flavin-dependent dehydrogenase